MLKRILSIAVLIAVSLYFTGCQTMNGLGGDIKWTGEQIEAGGANGTPAPSNAPKSK
jgi:predicted small secreted protein